MLGVPAPLVLEPQRPYRFTVDDLYCMAANGIIKDDDRVELIEGELVMMPPIDPGHAEGTDNSQHRIDRQIEPQFRVRCQHPVHLSSISHPQPDIAVVKQQSYKDRHPGPDDILLIIEVANSTLAYDLGRKKLMYATAAIPEYWVIDLNDRLLHVFTRPKRGDYTEHRIFAHDESVQSTTLKSIKVRVADLLP